MHIETERKFLIKRPDTDKLTENGADFMKIKQTYLCDNEVTGAERRIRKITFSDKTIKYVKTEKTRISSLSRTEDECEISKEEYLNLYKEAVTELTKTRYAFPYGGHVIEIDIYPKRIGGKKLDGLAVMEVELEDENEKVILPPWIEIEKELTGGREYSNKTLAKAVK